MRYIYLKNKISYLEAYSRKTFIEDVFDITMRMTLYENYLLLESDKDIMINILIICGHNDKVYDFLSNEVIKEKKIYMISCYTYPLNQLKFKNKKIFISKNANNLTKIYDGNIFNFTFDVTETEILLYNYRSYDDNYKLSKSFLEV